jgi:hypothetical protein
MEYWNTARMEDGTDSIIPIAGRAAHYQGYEGDAYEHKESRFRLD